MGRKPDFLLQAEKDLKEIRELKKELEALEEEWKDPLLDLEIEEEGILVSVGKTVVAMLIAAALVGGVAAGLLWVKKTHEQIQLKKELLRYGFRLPSAE